MTKKELRTIERLVKQWDKFGDEGKKFWAMARRDGASVNPLYVGELLDEVDGNGNVVREWTVIDLGQAEPWSTTEHGMIWTATVNNILKATGGVGRCEERIHGPACNRVIMGSWMRTNRLVLRPRRNQATKKVAKGAQ